jgi:predicted secreted protein
VFKETELRLSLHQNANGVRQWLACVALCAGTSWAAAQAAPVSASTGPAGVLVISASATVEAPKDWMTLTLAVTKEGADAGAVQHQLKQILAAGLAAGRPVAQPEQLELRTGGFSVSPRYDAKGNPSGWTGRAELVVEGKDMAAIGQLSGRLSGLTIAQVGYSLSRATRERLEAQATEQAIGRYRARAADYAKLFGYASYSLREVNVNAESEMSAPQPQLMRAMSFAKEADTALPVEAGKGSVTAQVSGSIQLLP